MTGSNEFQFFWAEGPLNWVSQLCLRSFTRFSEITVHLYSYDRDLNPDIQGCVCHDASEYLPREIHERVKASFGRGAVAYSLTADMFRYRLLHEKGGWYFDTDCLLIRPLDPLFNLDYVFAWDSSTHANNAILKFPEGEVMLDRLYKACVRMSYDAPDPSMMRPSGWTSLFTEYLKKFNLTDRALPRNYFYAISWWEQQHSSKVEENPYVLHLYASTKEAFWVRSVTDRTKALERQIQTLNKQIDALNNSLSLRIGRSIPFGAAIRKLLDRHE